MLQFKEVELSDISRVTELMRQSNFRGSDFTFSNLFNWSKIYNIKIAYFADMLIVRSGEESHNFMYPIGGGDFKAAVNAQLEEARQSDTPFVMYSIPAEGVERLEREFPGKFSFKSIRDNFDYIYLREKLADLSGKKLHAKRTNVNRFLETFSDWRYERLSDKNMNDVREMNTEWCRINDCGATHSLRREACAVKSALEHYDELGLLGGVLYAGGRVIAFTFGSQCTEDTFVVHVEKAFSDIQGAYQMINQQFVKNELAAYNYVNREDDVGDEGLRRAKESYRPDIMYERYRAVLN